VNFSSILLSWYAINKRPLPWRSDIKPYKIWLSEIIFQQTRIDQGIAYYHRFIEAYPDILQLANASIDSVLKLWQGLGYYSRARYLHQTANIIINNFQGEFPQDLKELKKLPGIGNYTAAAIASICFGKSEPVLDGNAIRVYCRFLGIAGDTTKSSTRSEIMKAANSLISEKHPGDYNQAVMEFGALHCTPANPDCSTCPFRNHCSAYRQKTVSHIPYKNPSTKKKNRHFHYFCISDESLSFIYLLKRQKKDIWNGLYEFPMIETEKESSLEELFSIVFFSQHFKKDLHIRSTENPAKHILSHQNLFLCFYHIIIGEEQNLIPGSDWIKIKTSVVHEYPVAKPIADYLQKLLK
jgi:A/G-specific adenine glycosylase